METTDIVLGLLALLSGLGLYWRQRGKNAERVLDLEKQKNVFNKELEDNTVRLAVEEATRALLNKEIKTNVTLEENNDFFNKH